MSFSLFFSSLRVTLPIRILCIVIVVFFLSIVITLTIFDSIIRSIKNEYAENAAIAISSSATIQIRQAKHDLKVIATLPHIREALMNLPAAHKIATFQKMYPELTKSLISIQDAYGFYRNLFFVNEYGEYIVGTKQTLLNSSAEEERQYIEKHIQAENIHVGEVIFNSNTKELLLPLFLRVEHGGKVGGLVATINMDDILSVAMRDVPHEEMHSMPVLVSSNDLQTLYAINKTFLPKNTQSINITLLENNRGVLLLVHNDEKLTIGYAKIPETPLCFLSIVDSTFRYSYLNTIRNVMILVGVVAAFIIFVAVYLFVRPVTRDIARISNFAKNITEGSTESEVFITRNDELGSLANSLEHMVLSLKEMIERSEAATKAKSDFLARMSHEIRTPMNGIIGMTYLAMSASPDIKQMQYLERIDNASKSLLGIINDILDFSKIEANKMDMTMGSLELDSMLRSVQDMLMPACAEKQLTFSCTMDENVPRNILTDGLRLTQICTNLCSNAVKFTAQGYVSLHISLANTSHHEKNKEFELLFTVKDTGIGLSLAEQEFIFDAFTQADGTHTRKYGGTGLGLAICKKLVKLLGGDIHVYSKKGEGSTFSFTIKTTESTTKAIEVNNLDANEELPIVPLNILLVEDNEINQAIAIEILQEIGASVTVAHNGAEAVSAWESGEFDLILMDIQMPIMDGLTATKHIRASQKAYSKNVPILAMTAHAMTGDREKSLEVGMNDHITKPLDIKQLQALLSFWGNSSKESLQK